MIPIPEDKQVVVDEAIAALCTDGAEYIVCHRVVEHCVKNKPRQLVLQNGVVSYSVSVGDDMENERDYAVLSVASWVNELPFFSIMAKPSSIILHRQVALA